MLFDNETKQKKFKNKCIIQEELFSKKKVLEINVKIDCINDKLDNLNKKYDSENEEFKKNEIENKIIELIAELRTLTSYRKFLNYKLRLIRPIGDNKPTLAYLAKKARDELQKK